MRKLLLVERHRALAFLVAVCAAFCWWPVILEPSLGMPAVVPLIVIASCVGLASTLAPNHWLLFGIASAAATGLGMMVGYRVWPSEDGIAQSYAGIACLVATLAVAVVSVLAGLAGRAMSRSIGNHRLAATIAFAGCVAFGPAVLAVRPTVIANRVARNDRVAAERFASLKAAVARTSQTPGGSRRICDGQTLKESYSGPPFSEGSWRLIAGNYVIEDGFFYGIQIDCSQPTHYLIDARPVRSKADGTRRFCTDESGKVGCGLDWTSSRNECTPCAE